MTAEQLLERFLFPRSQQQVHVSKLSGGERRRLYLLTVLMGNPNFLILDEPTNDLDVITLNVLENYLMEFPGCLLIISHDRFLLDKLVDHLFIMEGDGKIKDYNGRYSEYRALKKKEKYLNQEEQHVPKTVNVSEEQRKEKKKLVNRVGKLEREMEQLNDKKKSLEDKFLDSNLTVDQINDFSGQLETIKNTIETLELEWMEKSELLEEMD